MKSAAAILLTVFILTAAAPAMALDIRVQVWSSTVFCDDGVSLASIEVMLMDGEGSIKGWATDTANYYGEWEVRFSPGVYIMPGDRLLVWENSTEYELDDIRAVRITRIAPRRDVVAGRINPPFPEAEVRITGTRLTPTGETDVEMNMTVPVAEDGTFRADFSGTGDIKRLDEVYAGYVVGPFTVCNIELSPGLAVYTNYNFALLAGMRGAHYTLDLLSRRGRVRASAVAQPGTMYQGQGFAEFLRRGGVPVIIRPGNRIRVRGPWGFTDRVDRLTLSVDVAADTFTVTARPGSVVKLEAEQEEAYQTADENGEIIYNWSASSGYDVQPFDLCSATCFDAQGNMYTVFVQPY